MKRRIVSSRRFRWFRFAASLRHPQAGGGGLRSRSYCCCKLTDDGRHVDKLGLHRLHFRFDPVHLPCETLRAAVRANPHGLSATQTGQLLQRGAQHRLDF